MSRLLARFKGLFSNRTLVGVDKAGNRYFTVTEEIDGVMKEKRWVAFKGEEQEPTSVPVEWICWLNGQRKRAPTPEELAELEARREQVRLNVALLKKEEEQRKATKGAGGKVGATGKVAGPNLRSFIQQLPIEGEKAGEASDASTGIRSSKEIKPEKELQYQVSQKQEEASNIQTWDLATSNMTRYTLDASLAIKCCPLTFNGLKKLHSKHTFNIIFTAGVNALLSVMRCQFL